MTMKKKKLKNPCESAGELPESAVTKGELPDCRQRGKKKYATNLVADIEERKNVHTTLLQVSQKKKVCNFLTHKSHIFKLDHYLCMDDRTEYRQ